MRYLTCEACRFNPGECALRLQTEESVRAFNRTASGRMTALRFSCPDRLIGFDRGAQVVVEEAVHDHEGFVIGVEEVTGTVLGHLTDHVQIWLDEETSRGMRWIRLKPIPRRQSGAIGVVATGRRGDLRAASLEMIRSIEKRRGDAPESLFWCDHCGRHVDEFLACLNRDGEPRCSHCGSRTLDREEVAE